MKVDKFDTCSVCSKKLEESTHTKFTDLFCEECVLSEIQHINNLLREVPDGETWEVKLTIFSIKGKETEYHVRYSYNDCYERMHIKKNQILQILHIFDRHTRPEEGLSVLDTMAQVILTKEQHLLLYSIEGGN